jgi:sugar phosphate isomerase/epimerase
VRLGCFAHQFIAGGMPFEQLLIACREAGVTELELGVANRTGTPDMLAADLLRSPREAAALREKVEAAGLRIGALNCFGNLLHPNAAEAEADRQGVDDTIRLAESLGVGTVVSASGCPGDVNWPVWITWPLYWDELAESQWEAAIATWMPLAAMAAEAGVDICLELHPGQLVYNTSTLLRLRDAAGPAVKANLDPAHLFYQGMDPTRVAVALGEALGHVHAKDTLIDEERMALDGVIDTSSLASVDRVWRYVAVGDGRPIEWWRMFLDTLRTSGYTGMISIEHEDAGLTAPEALDRNVRGLRMAGIGEAESWTS